MRILLDQNVPYPLLKHLAGHPATHAYDVGWGELENGALIAAAEAEGFELLITGDKNLEYQQNMADRSLAQMGVVIRDRYLTIPGSAKPEGPLNLTVPSSGTSICAATESSGRNTVWKAMQRSLR